MLILVNTVFLAIEYHNMPKDLEDVLEVGNTVFTIVFAGEMLLKIFGLGFRGYVSDGFNIFDGLIVLFGKNFIIISGILELSKLIQSSGITVLRAFRLLRIFKIVKSWSTLKNLLQTVINVIECI
jgi:hypothetical protein